jgi:MFS family permease
LLCIAVALSGTDATHFVVSLFVLGVGWNFLFTAGTSLSLKAYRPEERDKTQGAINFCVFAMMMISSFSSGALVTTRGWALLNYVSLLLIGATAIAVLWYALKERARDQAVA